MSDLPARRPFLGAATDVAQHVLGMTLQHGRTAGVVVETEAYDQNDAASHSCRGRTPRNQIMFEAPGRAYVYRSYGIHWCINVVCGPPDFGAAVLLRALLPTAGLPLMRQRRQLPPEAADLRLARGPGCLTQALDITAAHYGVDLLAPTNAMALQLHARRQPLPPEAVVATPRIGISCAQDALWRFCLAGSPYVSGRRTRLP